MIRVAFLGAAQSKEWMGGLNYFKNLLYAISNMEDTLIQPVVFVGKNTDNEIKNIYKKYAEVVEHSLFDRKSFQWFLWQVTYNYFGSTYILDHLLNLHNIKILSHSNIVGLTSCKTINWIPDFQYLHLPNMFSEKGLKLRKKRDLGIIKNSDKIILSSYDALNDFKTFAPKSINKVSILQFVSQPDNNFFKLDENDKIKLLKKYNLPETFFYIPNQFWKHKNHLIIFEAVKLLKSKGMEVNVVCTGYMHDKRHISHIDNIIEFIKSNNLEHNIYLLGLVPYEDVFSFIKFSKAVINPSLFEGWSSTVEECKSVRKPIILSDIPIHREQNPDISIYFNPNSVENAVDALKLGYSDNGFNLKTKTSDVLEKRMLDFSQTYQEIILSTLQVLTHEK